jgi:hypothetical protein
MLTSIYNAIQGNRAYLPKPCLRMDSVFCCHSHYPLSGDETTCLDFWYSHIPTHHGSIIYHRWLFGHEIDVVVSIVSCNAPHQPCGGGVLALLLHKLARQAPLKRQPAFNPGDWRICHFLVVSIIYSPGQMPAVPRSRSPRFEPYPHLRTAQCR